MKAIVLQLDQFSPSVSPGGNVRPWEIILRPLLEIVAWGNCVQLQTNPDIAPLYEYVRRGLVRYQREPSLQEWARQILGQSPRSSPLDDGVELFNGIKQVLRDGTGDCDDLCSWRVAELRVRGSLPYYPNGEPADFVITKYDASNDQDLLYHIQVRRAPTPEHPNPRDPFLVEDPSALAGMASAVGLPQGHTAPPLIPPIDPRLIQQMTIKPASPLDVVARM